MDPGQTPTNADVLKFTAENPIKESGFFGTRRGWKNIHWYEYAFLAVGIFAALVTDGLTIARLTQLDPSIKNEDFAYGILILVHSIFLLQFLITGIFYQRISDIVAFFISAVLLTAYVISHYFSRRKQNIGEHNNQAEIRLARLILTIVFNACFIPLSFLVIKDYRRDEFSKRLFGAFPAARLPLKIYSIYDCVVRINTMLSISSLVLNLYNFTDFEIVDLVFLIIGIPLTLLWLAVGLGMARLENYILVFVFYIFSLFQFGFLVYALYTAIRYSQEVARASTGTSTTAATVINLVPVLQVLYVCISCNLLTHILSMGFGIWCTRNFKQGLKERVFNNKIDLWFQERFSQS